MSKLIWQPKTVYQPSYNFDVVIDRQFLENMASTHLSHDLQNNMNNIATDTLQRLKIKWKNPLSFYKNSALVTQFYIGDNGTWLSLDHYDISSILQSKNLERNFFEYSSHNVDSSNEAYALMALVDQWVEYSDTLKSLAAKHSKT